jgi:C4-type Zn-finger protein
VEKDYVHWSEKHKAVPCNRCSYESNECKSGERNEQQKSTAKGIVRSIRDNNFLIYKTSLF